MKIRGIIGDYNNIRSSQTTGFEIEKIGLFVIDNLGDGTYTCTRLRDNAIEDSISDVDYKKLDSLIEFSYSEFDCICTNVHFNNLVESLVQEIIFQLTRDYETELDALKRQYLKHEIKNKYNGMLDDVNTITWTFTEQLTDICVKVTSLTSVERIEEIPDMEDLDDLIELVNNTNDCFVRRIYLKENSQNFINKRINIFKAEVSE